MKFEHIVKNAPLDATRIGYFLAPFGVKGAIKVSVIADPEHFLSLKRLWIENYGWLEVEKIEILASQIIISLIGINNRSMAENFKGLQIYALDTDLPKLEEGCYYYYQLNNLPVFFADKEVAKVIDVVDLGYQDLLIVENKFGIYRLPLQAPYIKVSKEIDKIILTKDLPQGLIEIA